MTENKLDAEVKRIMSLDLPLNERRRMAADAYCDAYNINPAGLIRVVFKLEALSIVARLMHMQLDNVTDSPRWGMVYYACKKSGAFVAMNPASFIRAVQTSIGASFKYLQAIFELRRSDYTHFATLRNARQKNRWCNGGAIPYKNRILDI